MVLSTSTITKESGEVSQQIRQSASNGRTDVAAHTRTRNVLVDFNSFFYYSRCYARDS